MCANSEGSGRTARMRRLAWDFAGRLCDKGHNLMSWLNYIKTNKENFSDLPVQQSFPFMSSYSEVATIDWEV